MKTVYAILTYRCNLSCPHCDLRERDDRWDKEKFVSALNHLPSDAVVILFGGEPTLFEDRLEAAWMTKRVSSVSTNLLMLGYNAWRVLLDRDISISTSWNSFRFTQKQYRVWLTNLDALGQLGRKCSVNITLTEDLFSDSVYKTMMMVLADIQRTDGVDKILFEHYVGEEATADYNKRCDDLLCRIHSDWKFSMSNEIESSILSEKGWRYDCQDVWTLEPDGQLRRGCPQADGRCTVLVECLACSHAEHCQPCILQHSCSFPKKLYTVLMKEKEDGSN